MHVGDFTAASVLQDLRKLAPVEAVHGNMDEPDLRELLPERAVVEVAGLEIGLVHDAGPAQGRHERLVGWFPACDLIAYGHSHRPERVQVGEAWIVNPGSPTERRRAPARTMAVLEAGVPEVVQLG